MKKTISFDDVLLVPKKSDISSRKEINLSVTMGGSSFSLPIISSPMDTVTEGEMCIAMAQHGGLGVVHRYNSPEQQSTLVRSVRSEVSNVAAAVGVTGDFLERSKMLISNGAQIICIDVAHGHHTNVERAIKSIKDSLGDAVSIMAGNVATAEAFEDLSLWGADIIRVGIGGGSICSTRIQTGHGVPTLQSVIDCRAASDAVLVADGGIKTAGDIVKALAAGADAVMLGSLLAGTSCSPGEVFQSKTGKKYKAYRGMASREAQQEWRGNASSLEGISTTIPYKGETSDILSDLSQNIRSGLSYSGARSIRELQLKSKFIVQSSASQQESGTHILANR